MTSPGFQSKAECDLSLEAGCLCETSAGISLHLAGLSTKVEMQTPGLCRKACQGSAGVACTLYVHWNSKPRGSPLNTVPVGLPNPEALEMQIFQRTACLGTTGEGFPFPAPCRLSGATCSAMAVGQAPHISFASPAPTGTTQIASSPLLKDNFCCWHVLWASLLVVLRGCLMPWHFISFATAGLCCWVPPRIKPLCLLCQPLAPWCHLWVHLDSQISLLLSAFPCPCMSTALEEVLSRMEWAICLMSEGTGSCHTSQAFRVAQNTCLCTQSQLLPAITALVTPHFKCCSCFSSASSPQWSCTGSSSLSEWAALYLKPALAFAALCSCWAFFGGALVFPVDRALSSCQFALCLLTAWFSWGAGPKQK